MRQQDRRQELNRLYHAPANRKLKNAALAIGMASCLCLLLLALFIDSISFSLFHILRGLAGLGAIAFVVVSGVLVYRVNKQHLMRSSR